MKSEYNQAMFQALQDVDDGQAAVKAIDLFDKGSV